jgi:hypothetical protein
MIEKAKTTPEQRYQKVRSTKFHTYVSARMAFTSCATERKRIRLRADGSFDLVEYEKLPPKKQEVVS